MQTLSLIGCPLLKQQYLIPGDIAEISVTIKDLKDTGC